MEKLSILATRKGLNLNFQILIAILLCLFSFHLDDANAQIPQLINYQGMLTDSEGEPLATAEYKLSFKIFSVSAGGYAYWGPQIFDNLPVVRGHFNVILGPKDDTDRPIIWSFATQETYLEITVNDGAPIAPRQRILSAPYALNGVPAGTIVPFAGEGVPPGWLPCNGAALDSNIAPALFAAIGTAWGNGSNDAVPSTNFNLPDLMGRFLRGRNYGVGRDPDVTTRYASNPGGATGDAVGSIQGNATKLPNNDFALTAEGNHNHGNKLYHYTGKDNGGSGQANDHWNVRETVGVNSGNHSHTITGGDNETRPINAYVNWIIKF